MKYLSILSIILMFCCCRITKSKETELSKCVKCELCDSLRDSLLNQGFTILSSINNRRSDFSLTSDTSYKIEYIYTMYFLAKAENNNYALSCVEFESTEDLVKFTSDNEVKATGIKPRLKSSRENCLYRFSVTKESLTDELLKYDWLFDYVESY